MDMRYFILIRTFGISIVTALLLIASQIGLAFAADPASSDEWLKQLVIGSDDAQQRKLYSVIVGRPMTDNAVIVPWLEKNETHLQPLFDLELSRRLFADEKDASLEWLVIARLRMSYDALRCADPTVAGDGFALGFISARMVPDVVQYATENPAAYLVALQRAQQRSDLFAYDTSPRWICAHGLSTYRKALGQQQGQSADDVKPPSDWPGIEKGVQDELAKSITTEQKKIADSTAFTNQRAEEPQTVPDVVLSGSRADKVSAIGAEARLATKQIAITNQQPFLLVWLADAQINVNDFAGARATLKEAANVLVDSKGGFSTTTRENVIADWVKTGDPKSARDLADGIVDPIGKVSAYGVYGAALAHAGDKAGARAALELVERAAKGIGGTNSHEMQSMDSVSGTTRDQAIRRIGSALADASDFPGALNADDRLPSGPLRVALLADISEKQCTGHDESAARTLKLALAETREIESHQPKNFPGAWDIAYALATCGDSAGAVAAAHELNPGNGFVIPKVADWLTQHMDYAHARSLDEANMPDQPDADYLAGLAERQIARGDLAAAVKNLVIASRLGRTVLVAAIEGHQSLGKISDAGQPLKRVFEAQIKAGAFQDAISTTEPFDSDLRPQLLLQIVKEEAKRRDTDALNQTLPITIQSIQSDDYPQSRASILTQLGEILAWNGYVEQAHEPLALMKELDHQGIHSLFPNDINEGIAQLQASMDDVAGARATLNSVGEGRSSQQLSVLARCLAIIGDYKAALEFANELKNSSRNTALAEIAKEQAKSGDLNGAMTTAWPIDDAAPRSGVFLDILRILQRS
jgi:tetratricopeptide (TPR) repeat protein